MNMIVHNFVHARWRNLADILLPTISLTLRWLVCSNDNSYILRITLLWLAAFFDRAVYTKSCYIQTVRKYIGSNLPSPIKWYTTQNNNYINLQIHIAESYFAIDRSNVQINISFEWKYYIINFRKLRKPYVTRIHMNLFASILLQCFIRLVIYGDQVMYSIISHFISNYPIIIPSGWKWMLNF